MHFCQRPHGPQDPGPVTAPPIWSMLVYMLLTETLAVNTAALRRRLGLPLGAGYSSNLGTRSNNEGNRRSRRLVPTDEAGEGQSHSGQVVALSLTGTPRSRSGEKQLPFVHLGRRIGGGRSSVYSSGRSHVIVKFLTLLTLIPLCYGEYGGRALVLSDEGSSLAHLGMEFTSLGIVERLVLFGRLYLIHRLGVYRFDFEPRNVLRKGWCRLMIIDFAFSDVEHTCLGWRECWELRDAWYKRLQLDRLAFRHRSWMPLGKTGLVAGIVCVFFLYLFQRNLGHSTSGEPADWGIRPLLH
ncbi:hypothetical protein BJV78DRAFT_318311 [Lactifluus subvellereus]|nr:hypothetical protein BJV78DRAFT_318311 [Lactifluus subvellereus]